MTREAGNSSVARCYHPRPSSQQSNPFFPASWKQPPLYGIHVPFPSLMQNPSLVITMKKYVYLDAYVKTWEREARDNAGINAVWR